MALLTYATADNKLGPFAFVEWTNERGRSGPPEPTTNRSERIIRAGLNSVAVRKNGVMPESFVMVSGLDVTGPAQAKTFLTQYDTYAQAGPMQLYYIGQYWGYFAVLSVRLGQYTPCSGGSGGFNGSSATGYLTARWELVPVEVTA